MQNMLYFKDGQRVERGAADEADRLVHERDKRRVQGGGGAGH